MAPIDNVPREDWGPGGENRNPVAPSAPPSPEVVVNEVATQDSPSAATQALAETNGHAVDDVLARVDYGRNGVTVRPNSAPTTSDGDQIIDGLGYSARLFAKLQRAPGGFDVNDERLVEAAADFLESHEDPQGFRAAFDALPVSVRDKALETAMDWHGASREVLHQKFKGKLTLDEAHKAEPFMKRYGSVKR